MNRTLWHVGVVFVALGMMLAIVPTGSYSTIAGERGVDVSVAADDSALIALEGPDTLVTQSDNSTVTLRNNLDSAAWVQYDVTVGTKSLTVEPSSSSGTVEIPHNGGETITVSCASKPGNSTGTLTVSVEVDGDSATVSGASLETEVAYDCKAGNGNGNNGNGNNGNGNNGNGNNGNGNGNNGNGNGNA